MRPLSHQVFSAMPALLALLLVLLSGVPMALSPITLTPNVAFLATMVMVTHYPQGWPRGFAFLLGLLQDVLFATPLGSQALLALMLAQLVGMQGHRSQGMPFRMRWFEAAGILVVMHLLLWFVVHATLDHGASLRHLLRAALVSALWYPIFYAFGTRCFAGLPDAK